MKDTIEIEIKHFMDERKLFITSTNIKSNVHDILDDFWKKNEKLKHSYGTKGLYCTNVNLKG